MTDTPTASASLTDATHLGRVALRVESLDRVVPFYRDVVGLDVVREGTRAVLSAGNTSLIVLDEIPDAPARKPEQAGLFHLAIRVPDRGALGDALARIRDRATLSGSSDHLVSEALYLRDPEGNGVEIYRDRPRAEWPKTGDGRVQMDTLPLDLDSVLADARGDDRAHDCTDLGHVHLEVTDLSEALDFYVDALGMSLRDDGYPNAAFVAAGTYHHHVGLNRWNDRREPTGDSRGIEWFEVLVPDAETLDSVRESLTARGWNVEQMERGVAVSDPDGIEVRVRTDPSAAP
ncbi:Glyoxalase/bleomycin resistance protein/dioxygenase [Haloferax mucosum ATCC BAA-1512]|uniref:Glyoxalase/bleomycin resistance protein/dioxygenase n=1 Tax=Haloferax mucosum ATCC BAA-1512 TaxID=662479 RepID=M0IG75_9EURY|nr:VOC family protein [Haloferax mucosum]ELZ94853.1 Glyoxalase/bleomycin resistance protein/dioxygenase [Haloferax mucosum ATCC BAA-1512]